MISLTQQHKLIGLYILVAILLIRFIIFVLDNHDRHNGFVAYYSATQTLFSDHNLSLVYDQNWFQSQIDEHTDQVKDIYAANTPIMSFIAFPFNSLDFDIARSFWFFYHIILMGICIFLLNRFFALSQFSMLILIAITIAFLPFRMNLYIGQVYIMILLLMILLWHSLQKANLSWLSGLTVAIMILLKSLGAFFILYFIVKKDWKRAIATILSIVLIILFSLPLTGFDVWFVYVEEVSALMNESYLAATYQSIPGFFRHLFTFDNRFSPEPLIDSSELASALIIISGLLILFFTYRFAKRDQFSTTSLMVVIIVSLLLSPVSLTYHYIYLLLPMVYLWQKYYESFDLIHQALFLLSIALIGLAIPDHFLNGFMSLLSYSKFYGAVILFYLFLHCLKAKVNPDQNETTTPS